MLASGANGDYMTRPPRHLFQRSDSRNRRIAFFALIVVGLVLVLGLPSAALAAAPFASTSDAFSTGGTTATVEGVINPGGDSTSYAVQWDVNSSTWCQNFGSSGSPANTTNAPNPVGPDNSFDAVSVDLTGLTAGTDYCAQLTATNVDGGSDGGTVEWTQGLPDAITFNTFSTAGTTATVEGAINSTGQSAMYEVQYDLASSTWCQDFGTAGSPANTTSAQPFGFTDDNFHDLSVDLSSLTEKSTYCAQLVVTNGAGEGDGGTVSWTQGAPTVDTNTADATGATTATLTGDVNPAALDTSYEAAYDLASSDWCSSGGTSGSPAHTTAPVDLGHTDGAFYDVSVNLTGLSPSTDYCGEIVATNDDGPGESFQLSWSQPAMPKHTLTVMRTGIGSGTVTSSPTGINCGSTCSSSFDTGTQVTLTATAAAGSTFAGWSGGGCSGTGVCVFTLNGDTTVTATFSASSPPPPPVTKCMVPKVTGKTLAAAKRAIKSHHCGLGKVTKIKSAKKNKGHVVSQSPKPGKHLRKGSKVALKVGK